LRLIARNSSKRQLGRQPRGSIATRFVVGAINYDDFIELTGLGCEGAQAAL
jgi:hypothetical protein